MSGKRVPGFLPCFSLHKDKKYPVDEFFRNAAFVGKIETFLSSVLTCGNIIEIREKLGGQTVVAFDPEGDELDKRLCRQLGWTDGLLYRVDYGKTSYRLIFSIDPANRRVHLIALDSKHNTFKQS